MNFIDIVIVSLLLLFIVIGIRFQLRKRRKNKKLGLPNCAGCGLAGQCPSQNQSQK